MRLGAEQAPRPLLECFAHGPRQHIGQRAFPTQPLDDRAAVRRRAARPAAAQGRPSCRNTRRPHRSPLAILPEVSLSQVTCHGRGWGQRARLAFQGPQHALLFQVADPFLQRDVVPTYGSDTRHRPAAVGGHPFRALLRLTRESAGLRARVTDAHGVRGHSAWPSCDHRDRILSRLRSPPAPAGPRVHERPSSCRSSSAGSVVGAWQAKRWQTYAVARPSRRPRPSSSGDRRAAMPSPGRLPATARFGRKRR